MGSIQTEKMESFTKGMEDCVRDKMGNEESSTFTIGSIFERISQNNRKDHDEVGRVNYKHLPLTKNPTVMTGHQEQI